MALKDSATHVALAKMLTEKIDALVARVRRCGGNQYFIGGSN
jgi:hypothetical protein